MADFGVQLQADPAVALVPPVCSAPQPGPVHRTQYVIELVGPRSAPAATANALLQVQWAHALGSPEIFALAPADTVWRPLSALNQGSYDSLALCWDLVGPAGSLSGQSGDHLLQVAESFASQVGRRAMPMPTPPDLDKAVRAIGKIRDGLDVGISVVVVCRRSTVYERDLWIQCARLGLTFGSTGAFEWRCADHPSPLFSVTPLGNVDTFSLAGVQAGAYHDGVTLGFKVPTCPSPAAALDGMFRAADVIADAIGGGVFNPEGQELRTKDRGAMLRDLEGTVQVLNEINVQPGSAAALKIFGS
jgi:hypothetical protein